MAENQIIFALALLVTLFLLLILKPIALSLNWVDCPDERKLHDGRIPLIGGIAMFLAFAAVVLIFDPGLVSSHSLLAGAVLVVAIGLYDDCRPLSVRERFIAQAGAALLIVVDSGGLQSFGSILFTGELRLGVFALPMTVIAVAGGINAMNMIDGLDGLAGGLAAVCAAGLATMAILSGHAGTAWILFALLGALMCFLVFNARHPWRKRADVFMGDAGSMFLGFVLCWFLIDYSQGNERVMSPVTALWLFAIPLMDTLSVMMLRMRNGKSPFHPDRRHLHHILLRAGYSPAQVAWMIIAVAAAIAGIGIAGECFQVPDGVRFLGFVFMLILYYQVMRKAWRVAHWLKSHEAAAVNVSQLGEASQIEK